MIHLIAVKTNEKGEEEVNEVYSANSICFLCSAPCFVSMREWLSALYHIMDKSVRSEISIEAYLNNLLQIPLPPPTGDIAIEFYLPGTTKSVRYIRPNPSLLPKSEVSCF